MKTKTNISGAFLITITLLCATAHACCPPCPACHYQAGIWPNCRCAWDCSSCQKCQGGNCVYKCDPADCESCIGGICKVCGGDPSKCCLSGSCITKCDDITCYDPASEHCCGYGNGKTCANGTTCCGSNCCPDGQECCDEKTCYDPTTEHCCNYGTGKTCPIDETCCTGTQGEDCCDDETETCCDGKCCDKETECCDNGVCKKPICDNCHSLQDTVFECGHTEYDTHCQSDWCIIDVMDTATCDYNPNTNCPSKCTAETASGPEVMQYKVTSSGCLTGGDPVQFGTWQIQYYGCPTCAPHFHETACETFGCPGTIIDTAPRGVKKACTATCP